MIDDMGVTGLMKRNDWEVIFAKSTTQGSNGRPQLSLVAEFKNFVFPLKSDSNFEKVEILFRVKILRVIPHWEVPPSWYQL